MFNTVNAQFQKFVDFATEKWNANEKTAIARLGGGETALSARTITAAVRGTDSVGRINRGDDACNANNAVRTIFRNAVADIKAAIKAEMDADLAAVRAASNTTMTSLASGMMPQGVREYHAGYVTLNGQPIPIAKTDKEFLLADNVERRGYAEFLEEKFPEGRTKMRQTVSFVCGMALGLNGAVEHLLDKGRPGYDKILLGAPRSRAANHGAIMIQGSLDVRDNYDITEDEDGNVTIKLTHYASTGVINLLIGDEAIPCAKIDRAQPKVGEMKMTATVKITNATDAELGDAMPHFEVTDFTQEEVA